VNFFIFIEEKDKSKMFLPKIKKSLTKTQRLTKNPKSYILFKKTHDSSLCRGRHLNCFTELIMQMKKEI